MPVLRPSCLLQEKPVFGSRQHGNVHHLSLHSVERALTGPGPPPPPSPAALRSGIGPPRRQVAAPHPHDDEEDDRALGRIFGEELPSGLVMASLLPATEGE